MDLINFIKHEKIVLSRLTKFRILQNYRDENSRIFSFIFSIGKLVINFLGKRGKEEALT